MGVGAELDGDEEGMPGILTFMVEEAIGTYRQRMARRISPPPHSMGRVGVSVSGVSR